MPIPPPSHSPWGHVQSVNYLGPGIYDTETPGHGGVMVHRSQWGLLSQPARQRGERFGEWLCYEEDCAYAIVFWELADEALERAFAHSAKYRGSLRAIYAHLYEVLSGSEPDYLLELGIQPDIALHTRRLEWDAEREAWQAKNNELVRAEQLARYK